MTEPARSQLWLRLYGFLRGRSETGSLVRGSAHAFLANVGGAAVGVILQLLLTHRLSESGYGVYVYVLGWMNTALLLVKFEFDTCAVRFVSTYSGRGEWGLLRGFLSSTRRFVLTSSLAAATVIAVALFLFRDRVASELWVPGLLACLILVPTTLLNVQAGCLQGFKRLGAALTPLLLLRPLFLLVAVASLTLLLKQPLSAPRALVLNLATSIAAATVSAWLLRASVARIERATPALQRDLWFGTSLGLLPASLSQQVLGLTTDVLVIGTMLSPQMSGQYNIAAQLAVLMGYNILALGAAAAPVIADLYGRRELEELRRVVKVVARLNLAITGTLFAGVLLAGHAILGLFGQGYADGYPVLVIHGVGQLLSTVGGQAALMLTMTGYQRDASKIIGASALLNLSLSLVLTAHYGIVGTAIATVGASVVRNLLLIYWGERRTSVSLLPW